MIRSAVTISLVPEAKAGPFVFHGDLAGGCRAASSLGFDAVEIFPPEPELFEEQDVGALLAQHKLKLAAVGTGAGWLRYKLSLTDPDRAKREQARLFIQSIIEVGAKLGAPAIIGSMQGRWGAGLLEREEATYYLTDALAGLGAYAATLGVPLLYEPLNRYETNFANTIDQGVTLLQAIPEGPGKGNVKLLADLFHMNIEEMNVAAALKQGAGDIGHIHFVDSNRRPAGLGHMEYKPIAEALRSIGYDGYCSAEAFPYPDSMEAARLTIESFNRIFRSDP